MFVPKEPESRCRKGVFGKSGGFTCALPAFVSIQIVTSRGTVRCSTWQWWGSVLCGPLWLAIHPFEEVPYAMIRLLLRLSLRLHVRRMRQYRWWGGVDAWRASKLSRAISSARSRAQARAPHLDTMPRVAASLTERHAGASECQATRFRLRRYNASSRQRGYGRLGAGRTRHR
jgi:hypothetical protein